MATKKTAKTKTVKAAAKPVPEKKAPAAKPAKAAKPVEAKVEACPVTCACPTTAKASVAKPVEEKPAAPKATRVTFRVRAEVGSKVFLAGSFNNWDATAKQLADKNGTGDFTCCVNLPKGRYEYKFVINGTWCADPECTEWVQNDMGTLNSVKVVD